MAMVALVLLLSAVSHAQEIITTQRLDTTTGLVSDANQTTRPPARRVPEPSATVLLLMGLSMIGLGSYCMERHKRRAYAPCQVRGLLGMRAGEALDHPTTCTSLLSHRDMPADDRATPPPMPYRDSLGVMSQVRGHLAPPVGWGKGGTASLGARRAFAQGFLNAWQGRGQRCFIELISQLVIPGDAHQ